jgi:hypothetical protein
MVIPDEQLLTRRRSDKRRNQSRVELVINAEITRMLGLTVPDTTRVDEVIE